MSDKIKYKCKKLSAGKYEYRDIIIVCIGYHSPDKKVVWEGYYKDTGICDFHGYSKYEVIKRIDKNLSK